MLMRHKPRKNTIIILVSLTLLLAIACMPAATPLPTTISITIPTSKVTSTSTPSLTPTSTSIPLTLTPTSRPTKTPTPTATPTPTPVPLPEMFHRVIPADEVFGGIGRLYSSPDGELWAITEEGVARLEGGSWNLYLTDYTGRLAGIDGSGRVWVVSGDGSEISAWYGAPSPDGAPSGDGGSWTTYGTDAGWTPLTESWYHYAHGGYSDALGRLWFATSQDVRVFDGERWIVFSPEDMGMGPPVGEDLDIVFGVAILESGTVWVRECEWGGPGPFGGRGVRWFDGSWHGADSPVASGCATAIAEDGAGNVWLGVEEYLWRYEPASGAWTEFAPPEPPIDGRFGFLHNLAVDPSGDPWPMIVICGGASCYGSVALYRVRDGVWNQIGGVAEYDGTQRGPLFGADGTPWVFWGWGVYRIVEDTPELMAPLYARSIVMDGSGRVWFLAWYEGRDWLWMLDI
jgi:hypothetical protein